MKKLLMMAVLLLFPMFFLGCFEDDNVNADSIAEDKIITDVKAESNKKSNDTNNTINIEEKKTNNSIQNDIDSSKNNSNNSLSEDTKEYYFPEEGKEDKASEIATSTPSIATTTPNADILDEEDYFSQPKSIYIPLIKEVYPQPSLENRVYEIIKNKGYNFKFSQRDTARYKANSMSQFDYFANSNPNLGGKKCETIFDAYNINYSSPQEFLMGGQYSSKVANNKIKSEKLASLIANNESMLKILEKNKDKENISVGIMAYWDSSQNKYELNIVIHIY